jgi:glutamyl-tRNA synthetase
MLRLATPLVQERMQLLSEAEGMLAFLLVADDGLVVADDAFASLGPDAAEVLDASLTALHEVEKWQAPDLEAALRAALVVGLGRKPKVAFGPLRVAVTGRRVSPPLFESMEILGPDSSIARIAALRARLG